MFVKSRPSNGDNCKLHTTVQLGTNTLRDSGIFNSVIADCFVSNSLVHTVHGYKASLWDSEVSTSIVENSLLHFCNLTDCDISGATLVGVKASNITVHRGLWTRAPIQREVDTSLEKFTVSECVGNYIDINCMCHPAEKWLGGAGDRYLRMRGFTVEDAGLLRQAVREIMDEKLRFDREGS